MIHAVLINRFTLRLMQDDALMNAYAKGDARAFEELYRRHKDGVFSFLRRQCDSFEVCEELAHDTWMAVIKQALAYQSNSASAQFKTWLYRIAHNRLVDHWRKYGGDANVLFEELSDVIANDVSTNPQPAIESHMQLEELLSSLATLSPEQTEAILLKIEGFSHAEIAEITSAKQETVKSRLRYAAKHLKLSMEFYA